MYKQRARRAAAALVLAPFLLSACACPLSTREQATLGGAALGAATGALLGAVVGSPGAGAAIGGALGGVTGAVVGDTQPPPQHRQLAQQRRALEQQRRIQAALNRKSGMH